jgi:hypothetical protein
MRSRFGTDDPIKSPTVAVNTFLTHYFLSLAEQVFTPRVVVIKVGGSSEVEVGEEKEDMQQTTGHKMTNN